MKVILYKIGLRCQFMKYVLDESRTRSTFDSLLMQYFSKSINKWFYIGSNRFLIDFTFELRGVNYRGENKNDNS